MSGQVTHEKGRQIVSAAELRKVLKADGETCYCRPAGWTEEWDAGKCPKHQRSTKRAMVDRDEVES